MSTQFDPVVILAGLASAGADPAVKDQVALMSSVIARELQELRQQLAAAQAAALKPTP